MAEEDKVTNGPSRVSSLPDSFPDINEKKLLRKMDLRIIPLFTVLYLWSFLDRGNIGNAKIEGLAESLNLKGMQYNMCLSIFFILYSSMIIPSNVVLRYVQPKNFIPLTMVLWSVVMTLMGTVRNYHQLMATRALLGIFEASLFPGISYILSIYYKKDEVLVREAIFFSAASMAGAFSGIFAAAISKMDDIGKYEGWRWIFILEGLITFVVGIVSWFYFPTYPSESSFLTAREREYVLHRVKFSSNRKSAEKDSCSPSGNVLDIGETNENDKKWVRAVFQDWQSWCMLLVYFGVNVPLYGISLFLPTIIKTLGYTSTKAQLMTAPVYIVAAIFSIFQAVWSDKIGLRSPFLLFNYMCVALGYTLCITLDPRSHPRAIYTACYIIALGVYPAFPLVVIWFSNNLSGSYKRAVGMAFQIGLGNFSGAFAANFYQTRDLPRFIVGHSLELGFTFLGIAAILAATIGYGICNRKRKSDIDKGVYQDYTQEDFLAMGDKSPHFVYRL